MHFREHDTGLLYVMSYSGACCWEPWTPCKPQSVVWHHSKVPWPSVGVPAICVLLCACWGGLRPCVGALDIELPYW